MWERLIDIAAYEYTDAIVNASGWNELDESSFKYVRRFLKHGQRDAAMYELALQHNLEVIPPGATITELGIGAHCHDIAKPWINNTDKTLWDKKGLTVEDIKLIHTHPEASYQLLCDIRSRGIAVPEVALVIARSHHERLDGMGYPKELKADQIPAFVQLFCVVDYIVSMAEGSEVRSYRDRGMTITEISSYLTNEMKCKLNQHYVASVLEIIRNGEHLTAPELEDVDSLRMLV
jgi:HD-GYP domain-containing protein (c-di-GMP phosphodiesterase class II)